MKGKKVAVGVLFGALAAMMVLFAFTDLSISQAVFNIQSGFGHFFDVWGEEVAMVAGVLSLAILFGATARNAKGVKRILLCMLFGVLMLLQCIMFAYIPVHRMVNGSPLYTVLLFALLAAAGVVMILKAKPDAHWRRIGWIGFFYSLAGTVVVNILKVIWGRVRFREMGEGVQAFSMWFLPQLTKWQGVYEDPASFPSGHAANAAVILVITLLPSVFPKLNGKEPLLWAISLLYVAVVGFSRVVMGAHFASDVTMSLILQLLLFFGIQKLVDRRMGYDRLHNTFAK